ncbi:PstS family phosphate ABC transporter substrate-binding protein [Gynuella sp.]|uniref:PstS family phosphate ABC transporter substrate-binding protein n=1 Tax=Gynuella sp. TaxID=2969146 RepID=UPI003D127C51
MKSITLTAATLVASLALAGHATARDQIQIAGSSTVLPYAKIVAENFGETYPNFKTPVVESGGSSAGLKEFCKGVDLNTIDIANASRKIKDSEIKVCAEKGVTEIQEIRIGYDGIVFATDINGPDFAISPKDIYLALAAKVPSNGKMVNNTYTKWSDVNSKFPSWDITAYIPGEKHGTREVFETKLLEAGCKATGAYDLYVGAGMNKKAAKKACYAVRKDGRAVDIDGDYTETLARIDANKQGMGVFGLAFYENNTDKLKVATVNGIVPSTESIASGKYPVSRPLYFYVKKKHLGAIAGLKEYVEYFISDAMVGPDSPLAEYGLVAAPANERKAVRADFKAGKTL